jgi:hypothetical protein
MGVWWLNYKTEKKENGKDCRVGRLSEWKRRYDMENWGRCGWKKVRKGKWKEKGKCEGKKGKMVTVGFEPTPSRTSALNWRLRPLGQITFHFICNLDLEIYPRKPKTKVSILQTHIQYTKLLKSLPTHLLKHTQHLSSKIPDPRPPFPNFLHIPPITYTGTHSLSQIFNQANFNVECHVLHKI